MKLSKIYSRYSFLATFIVIILCALTQYVIFESLVNKTSDETLADYKKNLLKMTEQHQRLIDDVELGIKKGRLVYSEIPEYDKENVQYNDTVIWHHRTQRYRTFRTISFPVQVNEKVYQATVLLRTMGKKDMMFAKIVTFICIFLLLMLYILLMRGFITSKIWCPIKRFIDELGQASIHSDLKYEFTKSSVDEINQLEKAFMQMMNRIHKDFRKSKEWSENVTHEMQTPLTIMRSKTDLLLEMHQDDSKTIELLHIMQKNINRMSVFNRSLMLLTRINNQQYDDKVTCDFNSYIKEKAEEYSEFFELKAITYTLREEGTFIHLIDEALLYILLNNIFSNAMRYASKDDGEIAVLIHNDKITFTNNYSGAIPQGDLFNRFNRTNTREDSTGLGLSIVKAIADLSDLKVKARFTGSFFIFTIEKSDS
ncbi:MAG: sensor histidine kinase [Bacteroidales bacterium]